jgi:hypothetical protein
VQRFTLSRIAYPRPVPLAFTCRTLSLFMPCRKLMSIGYDATQPIEFHQGRNIAAKFDSLAERSRYKPKKRRAEANTSPPVSSAE